MIANIFVCDRSFAFNGKDTLEDLRRKILGMKSLFSAIEKKRSENNLYVQHENFSNTVFSGDGDTIGMLVLGTEEDQRKMKIKYSRDVFNLMFMIFNNTKRSIFTHEDMVSFLSEEYEEPDTCYGVVAMNSLDEFPATKQVLFNEKGFYSFRRHYIGKLVNDTDEFIQQVESYFDNLILNSDRHYFKEKLQEVIATHGVCIINCLIALSEDFKEEMLGNGIIEAPNSSLFLRQFAKSHGLDDGSFEGKNEKIELNCSFLRTRDDACLERISFYCGPHLKMFHDDKHRNDCHMRVYFAWDNNNLNYIYIGMITSHVN